MMKRKWMNRLMISLFLQVLLICIFKLWSPWTCWFFLMEIKTLPLYGADFFFSGMSKVACSHLTLFCRTVIPTHYHKAKMERNNFKGCRTIYTILSYVYFFKNMNISVFKYYSYCQCQYAATSWYMIRAVISYRTQIIACIALWDL